MTPEQHTNRGKWEKIHMIQTPSEKYTASPPLYAKKIAKFCEEKLRVHHTCRLPRPRGIIPVQAQQQHQMLNPFCRQQDLFPPILDSPPVFFVLPQSQEKNFQTNQEMQEQGKLRKKYLAWTVFLQSWCESMKKSEK
jgi:hypothetical protein